MIELFLQLNKIMMPALLLNKEILFKGCGIGVVPQLKCGIVRNEQKIATDSPIPS